MKIPKKKYTFRECIEKANYHAEKADEAILKKDNKGTEHHFSCSVLWNARAKEARNTPELHQD